MRYLGHAVQGDWLAICDRCGFKYRASQLERDWEGLYVCRECWEPRHPQDQIRTYDGKQSVPWTRPEPATDNFVSNVAIGHITISGARVDASKIWPTNRAFLTPSYTNVTYLAYDSNSSIDDINSHNLVLEIGWS